MAQLLSGPGSVSPGLAQVSEEAVSPLLLAQQEGQRSDQPPPFLLSLTLSASYWVLTRPIPTCLFESENQFAASS